MGIPYFYELWEPFMVEDYLFILIFINLFIIYRTYKIFMWVFDKFVVILKKIVNYGNEECIKNIFKDF